ncbi:hypothetical protein Pan161_43170 [Gimesia algae]|uniref:Uncharacterized protein n=1 Tax=Gimesia algae TaxID=2527971 RepID=A0A517VI10_9PLAN|nr:hypothetical protein Pan161_43170 [Gimesia algae]
MRTVHIRPPHGADRLSDQHDGLQHEWLRFTGFISIGNTAQSAAVDCRSRHDSWICPARLSFSGLSFML